MIDDDQLVRQSAFKFLAGLTKSFGEVLPYNRLKEGFSFNGIRVPLLAPQGIFKPKVLRLPLTITTSPNSPYNDSFTDGGLLQYQYRGTDPKHRDNVGLRNLMENGRPLIYLHGIVPGKYLATWPVYVVTDQPESLAFTVALDDKPEIVYNFDDDIQDIKTDLETEIRRRYVTSAVKVRLHQRKFRERVIRAYRQQCAMCRLKHTDLLDAAHITPDSDDNGEPIVSNGISLCKIHHAAFDKGILGIRPDLVVEIRTDILKEIDGPMLRYGLQAMHNSKLLVPRKFELRPDSNRLEERYQLFRNSM